MDKHFYKFQIRVLLYQDDGELVAHALEMDLLGYGKNEKDAVHDLQKLIESQVTFARQQNDDSLLNFPAPKEFFDRWETAHAAALKKQVFPDKVVKLKMTARIISMDEAVERKTKSTRHQFAPVEPSCA
jgi:hypothetical protein